jgi:hypothetical protein
MFKRVATTLVLAAIVGGTALAGDAKLGGVARQISMGGAPSLGIAANPFIFNDPVFQYINPAYQQQYLDYAWANVGGGPHTGTTESSDGYGVQHGGANFSLGDGLALGTVLAYDPSLANFLVASIAGDNSFLAVAPVEVLEVVGSYGFNNTALGLAIMYGWTSADNMNPGPPAQTFELTGSVIGFRGGIYHDLGSGNAVEGAVAFRSSSADDKGPDTSSTASNSEFLITARAKLRANNKVNFVIPVLFASSTGDASRAGVNLGDVSQTAFALGAGADVTVGDFYMAGGVSYAMQSGELKTPTLPSGEDVFKTTETAFPTINIGGEYRFTDWLVGRVGYYRAFVNSKDEFTPSGGMTSESNSFFGNSWVEVGSMYFYPFGRGGVSGYSDDNLVVLGIAGNFGMVGIEATVSESALRRGFGLIGASDAINTFGYMTVNVNFE